MFKLGLAGESSLIIYFGDRIDPNLPAQIRFYSQQLQQQFGSVIVNVVPSYTSLLVNYRIDRINYAALKAQVEQYLQTLRYTPQASQSAIHAIPVYYGPEVGLDCERLQAQKQLTLNELIALHTKPQYLVYAIGFSPNFAFLAEVDKRLATPRLAKPRISIPAGSVGIADQQTAVYPTQSSGGWNIIGRTPIDLSLKENSEHFVIGDTIKFSAINRQEYLQRGGKL